MSDVITITVIESRNKKEELRQAIGKLLIEFSRETGVMVDSINVDCSIRPNSHAIHYTLDMEVKLP